MEVQIFETKYLVKNKEIAIVSAITLAVSLVVGLTLSPIVGSVLAFLGIPALYIYGQVKEKPFKDVTFPTGKVNVKGDPIIGRYRGLYEPKILFAALTFIIATAIIGIKVASQTA